MHNQTAFTEDALWTPVRVYRFLCECFKRKPGHLCLTQQEFEIAKYEYVTRALKSWLSRTSGISTTIVSKRTYQRTQRKTLFELHESATGRDALGPRVGFVNELREREFAWIILKGEAKALTRDGSTGTAVKAILERRYPFLVQGRTSALSSALADKPFDLACAELAESLSVCPDSIPVVLSPSQMARASLPPWWAAQIKRFQETGKVLTKKGRLVGPGKTPIGKATRRPKKKSPTD